jgi:quinol-cytochrome oxidoreductase complex cytochrome b subunit
MSNKKNQGPMRNDPMLSVLALLIGLIAGIAVQQLTEKEWYVILFITIIAFGVYYLISLPFAENGKDFIPSQRSFRLVWGSLLTTVGVLLTVNTYSSLSIYVAAIILLAVAVVIVLYFYLSRSEAS